MRYTDAQKIFDGSARSESEAGKIHLGHADDKVRWRARIDISNESPSSLVHGSPTLARQAPQPLFCEQALEGFNALKRVLGQIFEERPALGQRGANMTEGKLHQEVRLRREVIVDRSERDGCGFRDLRDERRFVSTCRK